MRASLSTQLARKLGRFLLTRPQQVKWPGGVVSFTFDDFPKSALSAGGAILEQHGVRGTYYTAVGLAETDNHLGPMFDRADVGAAHANGHEIACHTFRHLDCGRDRHRASLLADIDAQRAAIRGPDRRLRRPISPFRSAASRFRRKGALSRRFASCRGTGDGINAGTVDLADLQRHASTMRADRTGSYRADRRGPRGRRLAHLLHARRRRRAVAVRLHAGDSSTRSSPMRPRTARCCRCATWSPGLSRRRRRVF